ncbi:BnaA10g16960D [Brassica napus]|uniref:Choline transporter-like protein n=1 Tax=Brassica napus TaxID=3708 RepID=A0A078HKQ5_BRANA|nr:BnaA10g16960D [Brassica napus]
MLREYFLLITHTVVFLNGLLISFTFFNHKSPSLSLSPSTTDSSPSYLFAFLQEIEQTVTTPAATQQPQQDVVTSPAAAQQQTLTGRFFRCLFTSIFYSQLILISALVIFLTLRGLLFTKSPNFHPKKWYTPLLSSVALSGLLSLSWQCLFLCNIASTSKATIILAPLLTFSVGIFLVLYGKTFVPGIGGLLILFSFAQAIHSWLFVTRRRREFTFTITALSTSVLPPRTRLIAVVSSILSVLYSAFLAAGIGGATATRRGLVDILFISLIVISLAWTMQVLKNVQVVAVSKAAYVHFANYDVINACDALFGNRYGFVHVGVHNKGFVQASRDAWQEFRRTVGLEELVDADLTSSICFLSAFGIGAISALTAGIWELNIHEDYFFQMTLYAFIIGYFVGRVSSAWLQACVMAYFVAYAANPEGANFDNTIPERIARQNVEENKRLADNEVRQTEEEEEITYIIYPLLIETYHFCLLFDFLKLFQPYRLCRLDIV